MAQRHPRNQVIYALSRKEHKGVMSVFLAGTTAKTNHPDWRESLTKGLAEFPITIINPYQADWDSSWREDITFEPYHEQVNWELDMQDQADMVVVFFHPETQVPLSLLELGLSARAGKAIVWWLEGYWKRGNVEIVCQRYGIEMVESTMGLMAAIADRLPEGSFKRGEDLTAS
ncbi:hypothetical protein F4779DRAFT_612137 [Xylariaceae sp. FL0662B]|nr:hypothetical protein F4779DRAFT_612137 [Xylariaceae sp. FL0662B]